MKCIITLSRKTSFLVVLNFQYSYVKNYKSIKVIKITLIFFQEEDNLDLIN